MESQNNLYFKKLSTVVIIGYFKNVEALIQANKKLGIDTHIITSTDQSNYFNASVKYKIFDNLNDKLEDYIKTNFNPFQTLFLSISARFIFTSYFINKVFKNNLVNYHSSRLPLDAGGGGYSWRILKEDRIDNMVFHMVDEGIDTGPIIQSQKKLFPSYCKIPQDFENHREKIFPEFYIKLIQRLSKGEKLNFIRQVDYIGSYNPRLDSLKDGFIDWSLDSRDLVNFINAFDDPYVGATTFLNRGNFGKLHLKKVHLHGGDGSNHPFMSGIVSRHDGEWIVVSTASKHMLLIEKVIDANFNNVIDKIKVGDRFHTPLEFFSNAKAERVIYGTKGKI